MHIQQPAVGAADCGKKQRTLASVVMKLCRPPLPQESERRRLCFLYFFRPKRPRKRFLLIVLNISVSGYTDVKRASQGKK